MSFPTFDKKDDIPKGFESEYEERDGKWHPKAADDTTALKGALDKERESRKAEAKRAKDAEDARADLERKLAAAGTGEEKDKVTKALAKFDADLAAAKAAHEAEVATLKGELRTIRLDDKVKAAFLKAGGRPERADKALNDTKALFDLADDGRIIVKDAKGEATTATVEDFFGKTYKAEMAEFYTGTKASGGGAAGGVGSSTATGGKISGDDLLANPLKVLQAANSEAA